MNLAKMTGLPGETAQNSDSALERLEDQTRWYDHKSNNCHKWYKRLKTLTIVNASLIPVITGFMNARYSSLAASGLGGIVAVVEGLQQLHQFHANWISYRSTCEALKHEKYLYLASAGPYAGAANARSLLVERVESLVSQEHGKWLSGQNPGTPQSTLK